MADKQPGEGKPWDAALGAVSKQLDDATKGVREATADGVGQARAAVLGNVEQAKELSSSARVAIVRSTQKAWEALQRAVRPAVAVFEQADSAEGTPLRKHFAIARESVNRQLYDAQVRGLGGRGGLANYDRELVVCRLCVGRDSGLQEGRGRAARARQVGARLFQDPCVLPVSLFPLQL